jgi:hypothetical protein
MFDTHAYFRTEIESVGRHWREIMAGFDEAAALRRPVEDMNHALWLTGHMTWAEDYLIVEVPTAKFERKKDWDHLFDHTSDRMSSERYPPWKEVCAEYLRVHEHALRHLSSQSAGALARPSALNRQWFPTASHSIAHQVTHGHYHLGQLIYLQKLLHEHPHAHQ